MAASKLHHSPQATPHTGTPSPTPFCSSSLPRRTAYQGVGLALQCWHKCLCRHGTRSAGVDMLYGTFATSDTSSLRWPKGWLGLLCPFPRNCGFQAIAAFQLRKYKISSQDDDCTEKGQCGEIEVLWNFPWNICKNSTQKWNLCSACLGKPPFVSFPCGKGTGEAMASSPLRQLFCCCRVEGHFVRLYSLTWSSRSGSEGHHQSQPAPPLPCPGMCSQPTQKEHNTGG